LFSLSCDSKQSGDQGHLSSHIPFCHPSHLPFPHHVHDLVSLEGSPRCQIGKEAHSQLRQSLDEPMILFDQIVEVLDLSQCTAFRKVSCCLEFPKRFWRGRVFVDIDHAWLARMRGSEGFEQEALGSTFISGRTRGENRVSFPRNRPPDTGTSTPFFPGERVRQPSPRVRCGLQMGTAAPIQFRSILLHPARNGRVIHLQPTFQHHFFQITVTE
jgi:hypothetical protein